MCYYTEQNLNMFNWKEEKFKLWYLQVFNTDEKYKPIRYIDLCVLQDSTQKYPNWSVYKDHK